MVMPPLDSYSLKKIFGLYSGMNTHDVENSNMLGSFVQLVSFDMSSDFINENILPGVAGAFLPELSKVYITQDFVALFSDDSFYNSTTNEWDSAPLILGFDITGDVTAAPRPFCFGRIPGHSMFNRISAELAGLFANASFYRCV